MQAGKRDHFYATCSDEVLFSGLSTGSHPVSLQRGIRVTTPTHALPPSFIGGPGTFMVTSTRSRTFPLRITHESNHHRATGGAAPQPSFTLNYLQEQTAHPTM